MAEKDIKHRKNVLSFWIVYVFLATVFIVSAGLILRQFADFRQSIDEYEKAKVIAGIPDMSDLSAVPSLDTDTNSTLGHESFTEDTAADGSDISRVPIDVSSGESSLDGSIMECLRMVDIGALKAVNPDVIGWIYITATDITYPIMHSDSNDRYIRSSWMDSNVYLTAGAIFMDRANSSDFSDFNTILYGHRMRNETMFGKLKYYESPGYLKEHPSVYIVTESYISRYDIYSVYEVRTSGETFQIGFGGDESKQAYIDFTLASSIYDTGIIPTVDDHILTLSTCSGIKDYSTRWVVQAVRRGYEGR